jgi:plasmid stabilization system protein ParE
MTYKVIVFKDAAQDVQGIKRFYKKVNPSVGDRYSQQIKIAIGSLKEMPLRYQVYPDDPRYRKMVVDRYLVFYVVNEKKKEVRVHRVLDGRMDIPKQLKSKMQN